MTETKFRTVQPPMLLHTGPVLELNEEQLFEFCRINQDWRIERTAEGDLETMPPTGDPALPGFVLDLKPLWELGF